MAENKEEQIILRIETYDNILTEKEGNYTAKPIVTGSVGNPQIAKRIMKGGLEVREETILYILDMADQAKAEAIAQGISVNDGVGQYLVNTRGSFDGPSAAFNPQIHSLGETYTIGKTLAALLKKIKVENRGLASLGPVINKVTDSTTLSENDEITPGAPITIEGKNMRVIGEDASVGLFFTPTAGGEESVPLRSKRPVEDHLRGARAQQRNVYDEYHNPGGFDQPYGENTAFLHFPRHPACRTERKRWRRPSGNRIIQACLEAPFKRSLKQASRHR